MQVTDKQLIPGKFGLGEKPVDLRALKRIIGTSLNNWERSRKITPAVREACEYLVENSAKGNDRFPLRFTGLSEKEYNIILKDFGELAGAIYLLSSGEYTHVKFPVGNEKLIDYVLVKKDGFEEKFSAKAGQGGKPSITSVMPVITEMEKDSGLEPHLKKAAQVLMYISTEEKNGLYFGPLRAAIYLKTPGYKSLMNTLKNLGVSNGVVGQSSIPSPEELLDAVNRCGSYENCLKKLDDFFVDSGYKPNLNATVTQRLIETPREGKEKKWGVLHYPITAELIKWLNDPRNGATDLLTRAANTLTVTQVYLDTQGKDLKYTVKGFSDAAFQFGSPSSMPRPTNNRIGFTMVKKSQKKTGL
jgi:hypothetical protein